MLSFTDKNMKNHRIRYFYFIYFFIFVFIGSCYLSKNYLTTPTNLTLILLFSNYFRVNIIDFFYSLIYFSHL